MKFQDKFYDIIDHNKCPSSEKSDEKHLLRKSNFHHVGCWRVAELGWPPDNRWPGSAALLIASGGAETSRVQIEIEACCCGH